MFFFLSFLTFQFLDRLLVHFWKQKLWNLEHGCIFFVCVLDAVNRSVWDRTVSHYKTKKLLRSNHTGSVLTHTHTVCGSVITLWSKGQLASRCHIWVKRLTQRHTPFPPAQTYVPMYACTHTLRHIYSWLEDVCGWCPPHRKLGAHLCVK